MPTKTTTPLSALQAQIATTRARAEENAQHAIDYKDSHDDFSPEGTILSHEPANTDKIGRAALIDYYRQAKYMIPTEEA